ncbi:hypothetical protein MQE22_01420 [Acidithiobacillus sp. YTS05]|uniref:Uncharacterized protein n=1 Tax=Igneacidithiobacillus copahuensis TaxID=2724909 RepID=A0AAE3CJH0_9PROT|nr:hypothetical protein [Igneacidithiobacillus copahuensis]MBU2787791.1 hypothetical protein [Igneacidithiobacillus copahuensis]MBU2797714.1 hypothetical protein [Acidithiobacillus sp. VAN18-2]UTV81301.1 hypothetical protein MQE22_01420 [Acidithiobacillus sp. YTS05]
MKQARGSFRKQIPNIFCLAMFMISVSFSASALAAVAPPIPGVRVQTEVLARVVGKGEQLNLPSLQNQHPGVVLWDELPPKTDQNENLQMNGVNLQGNRMMSTR